MQPTTPRGPHAPSVRQRLQDPRPAAQAAVHAGDHRRLPHRRLDPDPGVDVDILRDATGGGRPGNIVGIINVFAGGALQQMAVFALGIMPYITASIIMQLLAVVIPKLEELKREGEQGRKKITQYTRYGTVGLALLQSTALVTLARNGVAFDDQRHAGRRHRHIIVAVLTLTAGTSLIMWLGELITARGRQRHVAADLRLDHQPVPVPAASSASQNGWGWVVGVLLMGVVLTVAVVFMEMGQRRIPVQYARRQVGRAATAGSRPTSRSRSTSRASSRSSSPPR
jgi:preprotein translocase subunit SecY